MTGSVHTVRPEHDRLLRGGGRYVDDLNPAGCLHMAFVRSTVANAKIQTIETGHAAAQPGIRLVLTHGDLGGLDQPLPLLRAHPDVAHARTQPPLANDYVSHVGQPVAAIVAETRHEAEDACEFVEIEYEILDAAVPLDAAALGTALVHPDVAGNLAGVMTQGFGNVDATFAAAPFHERLNLRIERSCGSPIETRGVLASWDSRTERLEVWDSTQNPVAIHHGLVRMFGLSEEQVAVVAPDVGGGFGTKIMMFYPEEVLVPFAAMRLALPVKWIEDRWEHLVSAHQERGQIHEAEVAFDGEGRILGVRTHFLHDTGAFTPYGPGVPEVTMSHIPGQYRVENYEATAKIIYTNTPSVTPYRGAGRPQAVFVMERLIGAIARRLNVEPFEVRRRNLIPADAFPYDVGLELLGLPVVYDSGNYAAAFERIAELEPLERFRERQRDERANGRLLGIGFATYVEGAAPLSDGARCRLDDTGTVTVTISPPSQGQSHRTVFANLVAEILGVDSDSVSVVAGDSRRLTAGSGTFGSRAAVVVGSAVANAATALRDEIVAFASELLEVAPGDITIENGRVGVKGVPARSYALRDLASARNPIEYVRDSDGARELRSIAGRRSVSGRWPLFETHGYHNPTNMTYGSGVHCATVEVDAETGHVRVLSYTVVDDCGVALDHDVVKGQIYGGVVQGLGGALLEKIVFDSTGQPQTTTFMDFLLPTIEDIPVIRVESVETPSPLNPLGAKGVGEAGVIAVSAVLAEAIEDALGEYDVTIDEMPLMPEQVYALVAGRAGIDVERVSA